MATNTIFGIKKWKFVLSVFVFIIFIAPLIGVLFSDSNDKVAVVIHEPTEAEIAEIQRKKETDKIADDITKKNAEIIAEANDKNGIFNPIVVERASIKTDGLSIPMSFNRCLLEQESIKEAIALNYDTHVIASTDTLSIMRFCTNDGSVLSTCSSLDGIKITEKSSVICS